LIGFKLIGIFEIGNVIGDITGSISDI